jgi:HD-like signal output (HDOD) protein
MAEEQAMTDKVFSAVTLGDAIDVSINDIGIPPRPAILDRIGREMHLPEPDFHHLEQLICSDVALAAGLLKVANSAYFGFRTRARNVIQALTMLGLDVTSRALAGLILRRVFKTVHGLEQFWDFSARVARTSGWVAQQLELPGIVPADEAYTFGLFRDCGIAILTRRLPGYIDVLRLADADGEKNYTAIEDVAYPTNHALVGSLLAQDWWLPAETTLAIRHHHDVLVLDRGESVLSAASGHLIAVAQLSEHLVQRATQQFQNREWDKLGAACLRQLNLDEAAVSTLENDVPPEVVADGV